MENIVLVNRPAKRDLPVYRESTERDSIYPASYYNSINRIAGFIDHYVYQYEKSG